MRRCFAHLLSLATLSLLGACGDSAAPCPPTALVAAVGSNDAWDLQDRAKRVAIKGRVGAEGKVRGLRERPREYDGAMPGHREGLLDFERDACRRNPLLVGALAVAA